MKNKKTTKWKRRLIVTGCCFACVLLCGLITYLLNNAFLTGGMPTAWGPGDALAFWGAILTVLVAVAGVFFAYRGIKDQIADNQNSTSQTLEQNQKATQETLKQNQEATSKTLIHDQYLNEETLRKNVLPLLALDNLFEPSPEDKVRTKSKCKQITFTLHGSGNIEVDPSDELCSEPTDQPEATSEDTSPFEFSFLITNIGVGPALNVSISLSDSTRTYDQLELNSRNMLQQENITFTFTAPNRNYMKGSLELTLKYHDIYLNCYQQQHHFELYPNYWTGSANIKQTRISSM